MEKVCDHCGQNVRKYDVSLSEGIIHALVKFRQAVNNKGENKVHLLHDMKGDIQLTPHEWNNFSRLRFHALVAKYKENGIHLSGYWLLIHRGAQFLKGEVSIPNKVQVFNNKVIGYSERKVFMKDVLGKLPYFENIVDVEYNPVTEEDIEKAKPITKKKKGKQYCPKCDEQLKVDLRPFGGAYKRVLVCPQCEL